ncbi:PfkB family carbohydrate kinase [Knoellia subterranea]|uniref:Ribokinase n=1 Tax=Knoellia subterranea KCTC 19937 TaxID=1385521 RepID=A0A0A0JJV2_9MICO|nr:PfkB family carbohydrate kinase [Knoellia subterranea]KGN37383.1 ribokinase [Knoellia subterranea KCTC 19937]
MGRVVVLGSLNVDLVTRVERHPRPGETLLGEGLDRLAGGKGANQAVAAAAAGAHVHMVGCVGNDAGGTAYVERLSRRGIDVSRVREVEGQATGHALIAVDDAGENSIIVIPGANGALDDTEVAAVDELGPGDVLLVQLEVPLPVVCAAVRRAAHVGARVVLNTAPYAALPADVVALADPVVANEYEMVALAESGAVAGSLLVTFGANGASWDGETVPAHQVGPGAVRDTTGAGDAFCGALAAALASGADRATALDRALAAGAAAVQHEGAQPDPQL